MVALWLFSLVAMAVDALMACGASCGCAALGETAVFVTYVCAQVGVYIMYHAPYVVYRLASAY